MTRPKTHRSKTPKYARAYDAARRNYQYRALVDGTVTRRKLAALQAIGYSLTYLGQQMNPYRTQQSLSETFLSDAPIHRRTEKDIARLYDELSNNPPEGIYANRVRIRARRLGYAPPAAFDDINDLSESPKGVVRA